MIHILKTLIIMLVLVDFVDFVETYISIKFFDYEEANSVIRWHIRRLGLFFGLIIPFCILTPVLLYLFWLYDVYGAIIIEIAPILIEIAVFLFSLVLLFRVFIVVQNFILFFSNQWHEFKMKRAEKELRKRFRESDLFYIE